MKLRRFSFVLTTVYQESCRLSWYLATRSRYSRSVRGISPLEKGRGWLPLSQVSADTSRVGLFTTALELDPSISELLLLREFLLGLPLLL